MSSEDSSGDGEHEDKRNHCGTRKWSPIETHNREDNPFLDYSYANFSNLGAWTFVRVTDVTLITRNG